MPLVRVYVFKGEGVHGASRGDEAGSDARQRLLARNVAKRASVDSDMLSG